MFGVLKMVWQGLCDCSVVKVTSRESKFQVKGCNVSSPPIGWFLVHVIAHQVVMIDHIEIKSFEWYTQNSFITNITLVRQTYDGYFVKWSAYLMLTTCVFRSQVRMDNANFCYAHPIKIKIRRIEIIIINWGRGSMLKFGIRCHFMS